MLKPFQTYLSTSAHIQEKSIPYYLKWNVPEFPEISAQFPNFLSGPVGG